MRNCIYCNEVVSGEVLDHYKLCFGWRKVLKDLEKAKLNIVHFVKKYVVIK